LVAIQRRPGSTSVAGSPRALAMSKGAATLPWVSGATPSITDHTSACTRLTFASLISRTTCWPLSIRTNLTSTPGTCAWKARMSGRTIWSTISVVYQSAWPSLRAASSSAGSGR